MAALRWAVLDLPMRTAGGFDQQKRWSKRTGLERPPIALPTEVRWPPRIVGKLGGWL